MSGLFRVEETALLDRLQLLAPYAARIASRMDPLDFGVDLLDNRASCRLHAVITSPGTSRPHATRRKVPSSFLSYSLELRRLGTRGARSRDVGPTVTADASCQVVLVWLFAPLPREPRPGAPVAPILDQYGGSR